MYDPTLLVVPLRRRDIWRDLAHILSTIFNPFLTALALFVVLALLKSTSIVDFWRLLFISTFFTSLGPMLYVFWLYATDRVSDLNMSQRHERESVFFSFVIFYLVGTLVLWLVHAPLLLVATLAGYTVAAIIVQYITRYWKISTHALGITAPLVVLTLLYGRAPLPFFILIPMVGWARVYLRAHTVLQVIAGCFLGTVSVAGLFYVFHLVSL